MEVDNCLPSSLAHDFSSVGALAKCCLSHSARQSSGCTLKSACFLSGGKELTGKGTRTSSPGRGEFSLSPWVVVGEGVRGDTRETARSRGEGHGKKAVPHLLVDFLDISFPRKCVTFSDSALELRADLSHQPVKREDV